jgi:peptide/nickel transport system permease protein
VKKAITLDQAPAAGKGRGFDEVSEATQWRLVWLRFRRHKLAMFAAAVLWVYVLIVLLAPFLAPYGETTRDPDYVKGPPELIEIWENGPALPHVDAQVTVRGGAEDGFKYEVQPLEGTRKIRWFVRGERWSFLGLFKSDWHLFGVADAPSTDGARDPALETEAAGGFVHLLGTDDLGRDQFSRIMYATRISLTIGLAGLSVAFVLGLLFGAIAGYVGGWVDYLIQRLIEIIRSIPTIPLVMGLAAAFPLAWSNVRVFFFTSIILGLVGWTTLARRMRSMLLTLKDEDYVVAARLAGAGPVRVVTRHMLPTFFSYIMVTLAIEFPYMILAETVLSFVGLGLRPPTVSLGVLLQEAQRVETLEQTPWLLIPALFVVVAILAFNFLGDGLRDAADPYQEES